MLEREVPEETLYVNGEPILNIYSGSTRYGKKPWVGVWSDPSIYCQLDSQYAGSGKVAGALFKINGVPIRGRWPFLMIRWYGLMPTLLPYLLSILSVARIF